MLLQKKRFKDKVYTIICEINWISEPPNGYDNFFVLKRDWNRTLITQINKASSILFRHNKKSEGTFLVTPLSCLSIIQDSNGFHFNGIDSDKLGIFSGKIVYCDWGSNNNVIRSVILEKLGNISSEKILVCNYDTKSCVTINIL